MIKYIIFDIGKVLGYPKTGMWFITPKFLDLINNNNLDINKVKGLDVTLMDREKKIEKSKYRIINSLNNI